ncbi:MAG: OmpA family protein, partial [Saprospiraceae bacterium]|nr:OmpA family protein [Saprospiraceae bacterium]
SYPVLDEVFRFLVTNEDVIIELGGHTNTKPGDDYCDKLSRARAKAVAEYLFDKGVSRDQVIYKGYGKRKPLIPDDTYSLAAQRKNQRVEIKILSLEG